MGQRAVCIFHRMAGILQAGAESGQSDVFEQFSILPLQAGLSTELLAGNVLFLPYHRDSPHQAALKASNEVVFNPGMAGKASKGTWVTRCAGDTPVPQHSSVLSHIQAIICLLAPEEGFFLGELLWWCRCCLPLAPVACVPAIRARGTSKGAVALSKAGSLLPAN